jgi:pimeloyl-ACP methyl ester carboxylesterase
MEGTVQSPRQPTVKTTTSRGYATSYEDVGEGPPIVLITGLGGSVRQMREDGYVDRLAASGCRVLAVDPLGHGESGKLCEWEPYLWPDVADDVLAVMDAEGIERVPLWGYSNRFVPGTMLG